MDLIVGVTAVIPELPNRGSKSMQRSLYNDSSVNTLHKYCHEYQYPISHAHNFSTAGGSIGFEQYAFPLDDRYSSRSISAMTPVHFMRCTLFNLNVQ